MNPNEKTYKILIVDDEPANLRLLERLFRSEYQVITALSGKEGLKLLEQHEVALIISDQRMPGMTGIEFLKRAGEMRQHTVRIILTGYTDVNDLVDAINYGFIYKYVTKPWVNADLQQTVVRGLEHHEVKKARHELALQNERLSALLKTTQDEVVNLVSEAFCITNESGVCGHARRTGMYAAAIGQNLKLDSSELEQLKLAAFFHNLGDSGSLQPNMHLGTNKKTRLEEFYHERSIYKLAQIPFLNPVADIIQNLHENFDKSGSPRGLGGEQIPLFSRIIAVADFYDEMTSSTNPDTEHSHNEALTQLQNYAGSRLDPSIVDTFCKIESIGQIRNALEPEVFGLNQLSPKLYGDTSSLSLTAMFQGIKTSPILAFEVLRLANALDFDSKTANLLTAAMRLGEEKLHLFLETQGLPIGDTLLIKEWAEHSIHLAVTAQLLAVHTDLMNPDDAYTMGLLQNIGEVLLMNLFPDKIYELRNNRNDDFLNREIEFFGIESAQISEWMLSACCIHSDLTDAIGSSNLSMNINSPISLLLTVAGQIARADGKDTKAAIDLLSNDIVDLLRLSRHELIRISEIAINITNEFIEQQQKFHETVM